MPCPPSDDSAYSVNPPDAEHIPVLANEVSTLLAVKPGDRVLDCTLGLAGHAHRFAESAGKNGLLIGLDVDAATLAIASQRLAGCGCPFRVLQCNFTRIDDALAEVGQSQVDVIFADLGASSVQFDDASRGFSFQHDGPLDMRMDDRIGTTAADLVNRLPERELADLIYQYSQERSSRRIARLICQRRRKNRIVTTGELASIVQSAAGRAPFGRTRIHPATRTFQALRIAVNDELGALQKLTEKLAGCLAPGGRVAIISFHSLEDRIVKQHFATGSAEGIYQILTKKPITPAESERQDNPRSRSAKLRAAVRLFDQRTEP